MDKMLPLIQKFLDGTITSEERSKLKKWLSKSKHNLSFFKTQIRKSYLDSSLSFDSNKAYERFVAEIEKNPRPLRKLSFTKVRVAAVLVGIMTIGYFVSQSIFTSTPDSEAFEVSESTMLDGADDERITITLADGSTKVIDPNSMETLLDADGNIVASNKDEVMDFGTGQSSDHISNTLVYNQVSIPKGQIFKMKLSDGTLVWLNADSNLKFPQSFNSADERVVYLEGEGYFEVSRDKNKPFSVVTNEMNVQVLGTKFNVSSYKDDTDVVTTLVEGSVNVYETNAPENLIKLTPSYQASYNKGKHNFSNKRVDVSASLAWMSKKIVIDNLTFARILTKLERSHDVVFINNSKNIGVNTKYKGEFENEGIEAILETIALSTPFNFKREGNVITITD